MVFSGLTCLQSLKFRSSDFSLQRLSSLKFILGQKNFGSAKSVRVWKILGVNKFLAWKNYGSEKILDLRKNFNLCQMVSSMFFFLIEWHSLIDPLFYNDCPKFYVGKTRIMTCLLPCLWLAGNNLPIQTYIRIYILRNLIIPR